MVVINNDTPNKTKIFFENRRCAANFDNPKSPYYTMSQFFKSKTAVRVTECTKDPEQIAILIEKLINAPRPPFRNFPDASGKAIVMLRRVLPFSAFSALVYGVWKRGMARLSS